MTGLRGVAAILVTAYHYYPSGSIPSHVVSRFVGKGYLWVDLFFVLSGFLMAMNYAHLFADGWSLRGWLAFLLRRLARVYPLYIVLILASLAYTLVVYGDLHGAHPGPAVSLHNPLLDVAANVLMIQSWGLARSIDGVAWSLSTEWAAYLLFPILAGLALFARTRTALIVSLAVAAVVAGTVGLTAHDGAYHSGPLDAYDGRTVEPILRCLGGFVLGLLTYRAAQSARIRAWISHDIATGAVVAVLATGLALGVHDLLVYPLFALLVLGLYGNSGRVARLFGCRPVYWLGLVSYSLYLLHLYLLGPSHWLSRQLEAWLSPSAAELAASLAAYAFLLCLSGLAYRVVEKPGRQWVRNVGKALSSVISKERGNHRMAA